MKRRVVFSESDSDDEISSRSNTQQTIIEALKRQQDLSKETSKKKRANTIEAYFAQPVKAKKKEVSVDDFFSSSSTKQASSPPPSGRSTPPHTPLQIIPESPMIGESSLVSFGGKIGKSPEKAKK
ncbi:unnamed protein product, partial [Trichobilharzia regenti]